MKIFKLNLPVEERRELRDLKVSLTYFYKYFGLSMPMSASLDYLS